MVPYQIQPLLTLFHDSEKFVRNWVSHLRLDSLEDHLLMSAELLHQLQGFRPFRSRPPNSRPIKLLSGGASPRLVPQSSQRWTLFVQSSSESEYTRTTSSRSDLLWPASRSVVSQHCSNNCVKSRTTNLPKRTVRSSLQRSQLDVASSL